MKFNYSIIFLYFEYIRYFLRKKKQIAEGIVVLNRKKEEQPSNYFGSFTGILLNQ